MAVCLCIKETSLETGGSEFEVLKFYSVQDHVVVPYFCL